MSTIHLDSDGVIADWTKSVCKITGAVHPHGKLRPYQLDDQLTRDQIEAAHYPMAFWINLELYPWSKKLVNLIDNICPDWRILTKGAASPFSYSGKALWVEKHFPQHQNRLVVCRGSKAFSCRPGDILIDDHPKNIEEWNNAGGKGFHWPELSSVVDPHIVAQQFDDLEHFLVANYQSS